MQIADLHARIVEIIGEILGHFLSQCRDQDSLVALNAESNRLQKIINLPLDGLDHNLRIHQARGTDNLLNHAVGEPYLIRSWGRRKVELLAGPTEKLVKPKWSVIHGAGEAKAMLHEGPLSRGITLIHPANLRNCHV